MANTQGEQTGKASSWPKLISGIRDGVLVVASILYVFGYFAWSIYAYQNNLGLLPILESQYLIAGIVPALIVLLLCSVIRGIIRFRQRTQRWLAQAEAEWELTLRDTLVAIFHLSFFVFFVSGVFASFETALSIQAERVVHYSAYAMALFAFFLPPLPSDKDKVTVGRIFREIASIIRMDGGPGHAFRKLMNAYSTILVMFVVFLLSVAALRYFVETVYPSIPQEFGGSQPRCARLDVTVTQLSPETCEAILPTSSVHSENQVAQTIDMNVFFAGSEFMLVRPLTQRHGPEPEVHEIRRSVIQAVTWCSQRDNR